MALDTFPQFPKLPTELRFMIWEFAIHPAGDGIGIQTFGITTDCRPVDPAEQHDQIILPPPSFRRISSALEFMTPDQHGKLPFHQDQCHFLATVPALSRDGRVNNSAYLWDGGLWTACKESREIMLRQYRSAISPALQRKHPSPPFSTFDMGNDAEVVVEQRSPQIRVNCSVWRPDEKGSPWSLVLQPHRDAFKIDPMDLLQAIRGEDLQIRNKIDWASFFDELPNSGGTGSCYDIVTLVFDFDPNWCDDMPANFRTLTEERSPRGLVANLVDQASGHPASDGCLFFSVLLIDRNSTAPPTSGFSEVYYDCDEEIDVGGPWIKEVTESPSVPAEYNLNSQSMDSPTDSMEHANVTSGSSLPLLEPLRSMDARLFSTAAVGVLASVALIYVLEFLGKAWTNRSVCARMRQQGKPMPPWSAFLGHLMSAMKAVQDLPPNAAGPYVIHRLSKAYGTSGAYYLDTWPISAPLLVVTDANMANQVTSHPKVGSEKPRTLIDWFQPISGGTNLFTQNGTEWKTDHDMIIPALSNRNLDASLHLTVDQLLILRDKLRVNAKSGTLFQLEPLTLGMMNNVIGKFLFDADLGAQSHPHPLSERMIRQLSLTFSNHNPNATILSRLNPFLVYQKSNNSRVLNNLILDQVNSRLGVFKSGKTRDENDGFKCLVDMMLEEYFSQPGTDVSKKIDSAFLQRLCSQMRVLFFGGYDSTSATMVACCYSIWQNQDILRKLRAEHDQVFGSNINAAPDLISENPAIMNSLPYTNAVIKETLRLFPPANGIREGSPDLVLRAEDGTEYPTDGCAVQINHISIHHDPKYWPRPDEFLPERFLVEPGHELYPPRGAWRTFELGVRNCPGQSKVIRDVKTFLVIMSREFDFKECYAEVDGDEKRDVSWVFGEKAYLTEAGAAHLRDSYPCRVSFSGHAAGN